MIRVEELMTTAVLTLKEKDSIAAADAEMKLADVRHFPVVDERNHLVGMLSNRDVFRALGRKGAGPVKVAEVMSRRLVTVRPETPAYEAAELLIEHKIGALPVMGDDETVVGIVTETDFLSVAHQALHGRTGAQLIGA